MRTVEVDDDVFAELEKASYLTKMPVLQILRGLVLREMPKPIERLQTRPAGALSARDQRLRDFPHSPSFLANRNVVDQFLNLLSFVHQENPDKFEILESMEGRKRRYVARSDEELERSGVSVNAKRIPGTPFWVVTNNDTPNKKRLIAQALTLLGYSHETIRLVPESLR
jgi:negative modulator of initiation of replication